MSKGKYSPALTRKMIAEWDNNTFIYNADKQIPPETWPEGGYETRIHLANYDKDGFDSYGYSAFDIDGNYVCIGDGVDRYGYTEMDYLAMSDDEFETICIYGA